MTEKTLTVAGVLAEADRMLAVADAGRETIVGRFKDLHAQLAATRAGISAAEREREAADRTRVVLEEQLAAARAANADLQREREELSLQVGDLEERLGAAQKDAAIWLASARGGVQEADAARAAALEEVAQHFDQLAKETPIGAAFHGGPLHGTSIYNAHAHAARVVRALATRDALAGTKKGPTAPAAAPAEPPHEAAPGARSQSTPTPDTEARR